MLYHWTTVPLSDDFLSQGENLSKKRKRQLYKAHGDLPLAGSTQEANVVIDVQLRFHLAKIDNSHQKMVLDEFV